MSILNRYYLAPALGLLGKKGAAPVLPKPPRNIVQGIHSIATGNASVRRYAGNLTTCGIRYHKSRSMGGY